MWMFSRTLPRLVDSGTLKMCGKQIQTYLRNINTIGLSQSYSTALNITKLKHCDKINRFLLYPYANLQTSAKFCKSEEELRTIKVIFIKPGGEEIVFFGKPGQKVMDVALEQSDIIGEKLMEEFCGGDQWCTTCMVYVDQNIMHLFAKKDYHEKELIGYNPLFWKPNSRLSCSLVLRDGMTEVKFGLPPADHINWIEANSKGKIKTKDEKPEGLERILIRLKRILMRIVGKD